MIKLTLKNNGKAIYVNPKSIDLVMESTNPDGGCVIVVGRLTYELRQHASQVLEAMGVKGR